MTEHVVLEDDALDAAEQLREITRARKNLEAREAALKEILRKYLTAGERGVTPDGEEIVTVRAGARRWNEDRARELLPEDIQRAITRETLDGKKARQLLAPDLYGKCCDTSTDSVVAL